MPGPERSASSGSRTRRAGALPRLARMPTGFAGEESPDLWPRLPGTPRPELEEKLKPGTHVRLRGQLKRGGFQVRSYDLNGVAATADFAPVYPASEEVTPKRLLGLVARVLQHARDLPDPLPAEL